MSRQSRKGGPIRMRRVQRMREEQRLFHAVKAYMAEMQRAAMANYRANAAEYSQMCERLGLGEWVVTTDWIKMPDRA